MAAEQPASANEYILHHLTFLQNKDATGIVDFSVIHWDSVFFSVLLAVLFGGSFYLAARKARANTGVPGKFQNFIELQLSPTASIHGVLLDVLGVGVLLLKRLTDALRDQDLIHGVLRGWGVNQDGRTNGITAPSVSSQITLQKQVYERFGISPPAAGDRLTIMRLAAPSGRVPLVEPVDEPLRRLRLVARLAGVGRA